MHDSKSMYTTTGANISNRRFVNRRRVSSLDNLYWSWPSINAMCLHFIVLDSSLWSEEVTEPILRVSCEMIILCIILTKDAMFEFVQILEYKYQSIESGYHWNVNVLHRSTVVGRGIINDRCGKQVVVLIGNLQIGGLDQRWIHLDHLLISSDINDIRSIERSR